MGSKGTGTIFGAPFFVLVVFFFSSFARSLDEYTIPMRTHNAIWSVYSSQRFEKTISSRTWKVTCRDQKGGCDSVEQAHCTLGAVKRYRALV